MSLQAIVSDFGGVLTAPLRTGFEAYERRSGITLEQLGLAMADAAGVLGANPLFELETGRITEARFNGLLASALSRRLGRAVDLSGMGEQLFGGLQANQRMIDYMRELRERGLRLAICTNNVREWEARWRSTLPVDEIFDLVVDSAFVGVRKPDPDIYRITLERLDVPASQALLVDDIELNCDGARAVGMQAVWFQDTEQAIAEIERALAASGH
jgi:epoxide hydrolase-like predicted phosphatase